MNLPHFSFGNSSQVLIYVMATDELPRKLWEHPDPKGTEMYQFLESVNIHFGLKLKVLASDPLHRGILDLHSNRRSMTFTTGRSRTAPNSTAISSTTPTSSTRDDQLQSSMSPSP